MEKKYRTGNICFSVDCLWDEFIYILAQYTTHSLNIKNTFDLIEKLKPLLNYISSNIKKFMKEDEEYDPECSFMIIASVDFRNSDYINSQYDRFRRKKIGLFECDYGIDGLTEDMDIFQEIKSRMEDFIEEDHYNLLFNTNSFVVKVKHRNMWPYNEDFFETIDNKRTGSFERLEFFREGERRQERLTIRFNQINEKLQQDSNNSRLSQINERLTFLLSDY